MTDPRIALTSAASRRKSRVLFDLNRKRRASQVVAALQSFVIAVFLFALGPRLSVFGDHLPFDHNRLAALGDYVQAVTDGRNPKAYEGKKAESFLLVEILQPARRDVSITFSSDYNRTTHPNSVATSFLIRSPPHSAARL